MEPTKEMISNNSVAEFVLWIFFLRWSSWKIILRIYLCWQLIYKMLFELTKPAPSNTRRIKGNIDLMTIEQASAISQCLCDKNVILFLERWMDIIKKERKKESGDNRICDDDDDENCYISQAAWLAFCILYFDLSPPQILKSYVHSDRFVSYEQ